MITIPAGQCHWCHAWKENAFGQCPECHRFAPMNQTKIESLSYGKRRFIQASLLKTFFEILGYVKFYVHARLDFSKVSLSTIRNLIHDAYAMTVDPNHRSPEHPDLNLNDLIAAIMYLLGVEPNVTQSIDECTLMYGYGKCFEHGDFQFTIAHRFLKPGTTLRTFPTFYCDLQSKRETIQMHAWKEVA